MLGLVCLQAQQPCSDTEAWCSRNGLGCAVCTFIKRLAHCRACCRAHVSGAGGGLASACQQCCMIGVTKASACSRGGTRGTELQLLCCTPPTLLLHPAWACTQLLWSGRCALSTLPVACCGRWTAVTVACCVLWHGGMGWDRGAGRGCLCIRPEHMHGCKLLRPSCPGVSTCRHHCARRVCWCPCIMLGWCLVCRLSRSQNPTGVCVCVCVCVVMV